MRFYLIPGIFILFSCLAFSTLSFGQKKIEGYIFDKSTNQPISYAHVVLKNKIGGTISNEDGYFRIEGENLDLTDSILITHINYASYRESLQSEGTRKIFLSENSITLEEISITASEDYQIFEDIVNHSKESLSFPFTSELYFRELVKENKSFSKFADALLTVVFPKDKESLAVKVNQCRAVELPKEDDEAVDLVNPVKMDNILRYAYLNFLNKFRDERQQDYHYYLKEGKYFDDHYTLFIEPKKEANREDDKLLYFSIIKADQNKNIREVEIRLDSLCSFEKSLLGVKYRILDAVMAFNFGSVNGSYYLSYARFDFKVKISVGKKFEQVDNYVSDYMIKNLSFSETEIQRKDQFKKSSLYKHGEKYDYEFWKGINMPIFTSEEEKLIEALKKK